MHMEGYISGLGNDVTLIPNMSVCIYVTKLWMTIQSAPVGPGSITGYIKARYKPRNTRGNLKTVEEIR